MRKFYFDFETRSKVDLKVVGAVNYAMHLSTQVTAISWTIDNGPLKGWDLWCGRPVDPELIDVIQNPYKYLFVAHNIEFDYLIWTLVFANKFEGYVRPQVPNLHDNMAVSNYYRLGSTLEANARMLNLNLSKDKKGRSVMMYLSKPNSKGEYIDPKSAEDYQAFVRYYMGDTDILRQAEKMMPPLPPKERQLWEWTFRRNLIGVRIDTDLLHVFDYILGQQLPPLENRFKEITGCSSGSHVKMLEFFKEFYPWVVDTRKDTIEALMMDDTPVPPEVKEAIEIKFLLGGTALSKVPTGMNIQNGGRLYQLFDYSKAQNKRFAGRGIQPQNFPRFDKKRLDEFKFDLASPTLAQELLAAYPTLKDPVGVVKNLLRRIWLPDRPDHVFVAGDFSKIEPTVMFWLLDMGEIPSKWYEEMASTIYNIPIEEVGKESDERQVGKTAQLTCGYGGGAKAYRVKTFTDTGILLSAEMATKIVNTYRTKYPKVVQFWNDVEDAFHLASDHYITTPLCGGRVVVMPMPAPWKGVMIQLPSGSKLYYHRTSTREIKFKKKVTDLDSYGNKIIREVEETKLSMTYIEPTSNGALVPKAVYGGLLVENIVSCIAREVMVEAILRLEAHGYAVPGTVHDEAWGSIFDGHEKHFEQLMSVTPSWAPGLIVKTEVEKGIRYVK